MSTLLYIFQSYVSGICSIEAYIRIENKFNRMAFYIGILD